MGIKDLILNKGWAGRTISRAETADRINPVLESLTRLMHYYDSAVPVLSGADAARVEASQRTLRADLGKLAETIHSAGHVAYSGVDIEPGTLTVGDSPAGVLEREERAFADLLTAESKHEHQMHSRAILGVVHANGAERLKMIRAFSRV